jgi:hypothetical protein
MYIRDRKNEKRQEKDGVWMRKAKERRHIWSAAGELRRGSAWSVGEGRSRGGKVWDAKE